MIVTFIANLGADVKMREKDGHKFLSLYVCTDVFSAGERKPVWVNVSAPFRENLAEFLVKGRQVCIVGEFIPDRYTNSKGEDHVDLRVRAYSILLVGNSSSDAGSTDM